METSKANFYQTYILFFSWTIGLISVIVQLFVEVELSQMMLAVVLLDIILNVKKKNDRFSKHAFHFIALIIIFYGWLIISNAYSPSESYKFEKSFNFIANVIFFLYPFFIRKINFNLFIRLYCIIVLPLSVYFIYMKSILWSVNSASTQLFMDIRGAYLVFGIHLGILFLLLLYFNKSIFLKIFTFFLLLATGARGPLVMMLLVIFVYLFAEKKLKFPHPNGIIRAVFLLAVLFMIYLFKADTINSLLETSFTRFGSLLEGGDDSAADRLNMMKFAFHQPFDKLSTFLFGNGIGSFGIIHTRIDQRSYPHNILFECFFEMGIIGLIIFLLLLISVFRLISFKTSVFGLLFIYVFLNTMKSSSLIDLWILFSLMGGVVSRGKLISEESRPKKNSKISTLN